MSICESLDPKPSEIKRKGGKRERIHIKEHKLSAAEWAENVFMHNEDLYIEEPPTLGGFAKLQARAN